MNVFVYKNTFLFPQKKSAFVHHCCKRKINQKHIFVKYVNYCKTGVI